MQRKKKKLQQPRPRQIYARMLRRSCLTSSVDERKTALSLELTERSVAHIGRVGFCFFPVMWYMTGFCIRLFYLLFTAHFDLDHQLYPLPKGIVCRFHHDEYTCLSESKNIAPALNDSSGIAQI